MGDYIDHLARVPLFALCSTGDLEQIARVADEITVDRGRDLVVEGTSGTEAFVIVEGRARVTRDGAEVARLGPGDPFGEMALVEHAERNATVTAETAMHLLVIGQREFAGLLDESSEFRRAILAALAGRVRALDRQFYG